MKNTGNRAIVIKSVAVGIAALTAFTVMWIICWNLHLDRISEDSLLNLSLQNIEFVEIYYNPKLGGSVAVDRQTGVMYWFNQDGVATALINEEGRPRIWRDGK